jgi:hypothetical protein
MNIDIWEHDQVLDLPEEVQRKWVEYMIHYSIQKARSVIQDTDFYKFSEPYFKAYENSDQILLDKLACEKIEKYNEYGSYYMYYALISIIRRENINEVIYCAIDYDTNIDNWNVEETALLKSKLLQILNDYEVV